MKVHRNLGVLISVAVAALAGSASAALTTAGGSADASAKAIRHGSALNALPGETFEDWVTYADQVAVITVVSEQRMPLGEWEMQHGEGIVGRLIIVRAQKTLWNRPSGRSAPQEFIMNAPGWLLDENRLIDFALRGASRLEVGHTYISALADITYGGEGGWQPIAPEAVLPYDEGQIGRGETRGGEIRTAVADSAAGKRDGYFATQLAQVKPDPAAEAHSSKDPISRYRAVHWRTPPATASADSS